jgi:beta-glucosidase
VEWSSIEPTQGTFIEENLAYYVTLCQRLKKEGIEPLVTLHHFSDPQWFANLGGFEKEENIDLILPFAEKVFLTLSPYVKEWITINEPTSYILMGYVRGEFPPCKSNFALAGLVLKHLLQAHCHIYDHLKQLDKERTSKIGLAHNITRSKPYSWYHPVERIASYYLTHLMHQSLIDFFATGKFRFKIPFLAKASFNEPLIKSKFDFFGVQYYCDITLRMTLSKNFLESTCYPGEKMNSMGGRFSPQNIYFALQEASSLQKPIYITETGSADSEEDQLEFIQKALLATSQAMEQGMQIEKVYIWSLIDNFEWAYGWEKKFGLLRFDPNTQETSLKPSAKLIQKLSK